MGYAAKNHQLLFGNLNSLVSNKFYRDSSWLDDGSDTEALLFYAQISWDINELGVRKLRKQMFENRMKLSSSLIESYWQTISKNNTALLSEYSSASNFGREESKSAMESKNRFAFKFLCRLL